MPNLVGIPPVVWAPNPNKQTDRQTDRQASFIYIDNFPGNSYQVQLGPFLLGNLVGVGRRCGDAGHPLEVALGPVRAAVGPVGAADSVGHRAAAVPGINIVGEG